MVPASVGFQCPDDARAGRQGGGPARTAVGGTLAGTAARVTSGLIGLNVVVYLVGLAVPDLAERFGNLALAQTASGPVGVADGQWYRLLTAAFLHAGLFHLGSNMLALLAVGPQVEAALGRVRFLSLYVLSALGGSTLSYLVSAPDVLGVGASGAVFGLFGALYVLVRRTGGQTGQIAGLIALNLVITFALPIIDWRAHLGGLATGAVVAAALVYAPGERRRVPVQAALCLGVLGLLAVGVLLRTAALR